MTSLNRGLFSLAPGGGKMRDPGNEVVNTVKSRFIVNSDIVPVESRKETVRLSPERLLVL